MRRTLFIKQKLKTSHLMTFKGRTQRAARVDVKICEQSFNVSPRMGGEVQRQQLHYTKQIEKVFCLLYSLLN